MVGDLLLGLKFANSTNTAVHTFCSLQVGRTKVSMFHYSLNLFVEQSKNDYVLFQAASTIKEAILREWQMLNKEDVESLRTFLLAFVSQKQGYDNT